MFRLSDGLIRYVLNGLAANRKGHTVGMNIDAVLQAKGCSKTVAAGEMSGGVYGANCIGGNHMPDIVVIGWIVG